MPKTFEDNLKATTKIPDKYAVTYYRENFPSITTGAQLAIPIYPFIREIALRKIDEALNKEEIKYMKKIINSEHKPQFSSTKDALIAGLKDLSAKIDSGWIKSISFDQVIDKISNLDEITAIILSEYLVEKRKYSKRGDLQKQHDTVTVRILDSYANRYYTKNFPNLSVGVQAAITLYPYIRESALKRVKEYALKTEEIRYLLRIINSENDPGFCYSARFFAIKVTELEKVTGLGDNAGFAVDRVAETLSEFDDVTAIVLSEYLVSARKKTLVKDIVDRLST